MDDNKIIDLYLMRDESALVMTSEKYGSRLKDLSLGIVKDLRTAEECENDTYEKAWESIPPSEPRGHLYQYLACIVRRVSLNRCREQNKLKRKAFVSCLSAEMEQCISSPNDTECKVDEQTLCRLINEFIALLDDENRNIFIRRYWYIDSIKSISRRFGLSQSKVKTQLYRCRKKLREFLEKEGYEL